MKKTYSLALLSTLWLLFLIGGGVMAQDVLTCEDIAPENASSVYFIGLGDGYFEESNFTIAILAYTCAIGADPDYAPAYVNRGYAYAIQRNEPQALEDYNSALALDEGLVTAYNNRGLLYFGQGNFGLAINDFTLAITLDPDYAFAYNNRGLVHAAEGSYELAIADFQQAIALAPDYAAPHASLGATYSIMATNSFQEYRTVLGQESARLPGGKPEDVIRALAESLVTGNFAHWLSYVTPAE